MSTLHTQWCIPSQGQPLLTSAHCSVQGESGCHTLRSFDEGVKAVAVHQDWGSHAGIPEDNLRERLDSKIIPFVVGDLRNFHKMQSFGV